MELICFKYIASEKEVPTYSPVLRCHLREHTQPIKTLSSFNYKLIIVLFSNLIGFLFPSLPIDVFHPMFTEYFITYSLSDNILHNPILLVTNVLKIMTSLILIKKIKSCLLKLS